MGENDGFVREGIGSGRVERLSRDVTVGASCLLHHIVSQCEEGVKVLSRIIFYLLLGEAGITATDTAIQNRGTLEKTSYRKLCNYPGILYVSQYICAYISRRARGWKNANRGHRLRVRARVRNRVFLVENRVSRVLFRFDYSFGRRVNFEKIATESLFPIYSRKQTIFSESFGFRVYTR